MSVAVRHIPAPNRLAKLIKIPGGKRIADALAEARANLDELEEVCLGEIDAAVRAVQEASSAADRTPASFEAVYAAANAMIGLAGLFGREDLGKAAHSLCELLDRAGCWEACAPVALKVHVDSLVLLRNPNALSAEERERILEGLEKVVSRTRRAAE